MSIEFFGVDDKRAAETEDKLDPERTAYTSDSYISADVADNEVVIDGLKGDSTDVTDAISELEVPREEFQYTQGRHTQSFKVNTLLVSLYIPRFHLQKMQPGAEIFCCYKPV